MSELIVIAGPQAAGKSTVLANIKKQFDRIGSNRSPILFTLQESRQIIAHRDISFGAIFMTPKQECDAVSCDLARMDRIIERGRDRVIFLDECNIFTMAHAEAHGIRDMAMYWNDYIMRLQKLRAKIVFIDVPPELSWERRCTSYSKRLVYFPKKDHDLIMNTFRQYLHRLHPMLIRLYAELPFQKRLVDGLGSQKSVEARVMKALAELSPMFR